MAKGPKITGEIEIIITQVYLRNPGWRAKEIQGEVNRQLHERNPNVNPDWPGLSAVQKLLAKIRKQRKESPPNPEDSQWGITTLPQYEIHPELLPTVLRVWVEIHEKKWPQKLFTIREAKWIARLSHVFKDDLELLYYAAVVLANNQQMEELLSPNMAVDEEAFNLMNYGLTLRLYTDMTGNEFTIPESVKQRALYLWDISQSPNLTDPNKVKEETLK